MATVQADQAAKRMLLLATNAHPLTMRLREPEAYGDLLGRLLTPRHYSSLEATLAAGVPVAADNDCFQGLDRHAFEAMLEALEPHAGELLFVTAPDVVRQVEQPDGTVVPVGDAGRTLLRFRVWAPRIRARGFRVALVLQDGITLEDVPWSDLDAVFIGGSDIFKEGPVASAIVAEANRRGVWAHMGRVNSIRRLRVAYQMGCDSVDGSGWARWKSAMQPRWARFIAEVEEEEEEAEKVEPSRFTVTITDGCQVERHEDVSWRERNRLVDFAFRHALRAIVSTYEPRVRGARTYR